MIQRTLCFVLCLISIGAVEPGPLNGSPGQIGQAVQDGKVSRDGVDLLFRTVGDKGPLLIILSGGPGADPSYVQPVIAELSKNYQCLLFEQRGTGRSKLKTYDFRTI